MKKTSLVSKQTKRLNLRDLQDSDARTIAHLAGDPEVARMTTRIPHPYTESEARDWIRGIDPKEFVQGIDFEGYLIGLVGYTLTSERSAELGYWIGKPWWGRGFATEAAEFIVKYCFRTTNTTRISCSHFVDNPASARVIEKLGFRCIGVNKAFCLARNKDVDTLIYERKKTMMAFLWRGAA